MANAGTLELELKTGPGYRACLDVVDLVSELLPLWPEYLAAGRDELIARFDAMRTLISQELDRVAREEWRQPDTESFYREVTELCSFLSCYVVAMQARGQDMSEMAKSLQPVLLSLARRSADGSGR